MNNIYEIAWHHNRDEMFDVTDAMYRLYEQRPYPYWPTLADQAEEDLRTLGVDVEYGDPVHAVVNASIAHAYDAGIAKVAKLMGIDAAALIIVCNDCFENRETVGLSEVLEVVNQIVEERESLPQKDAA